MINPFHNLILTDCFEWVIVDWINAGTFSGYVSGSRIYIVQNGSITGNLNSSVWTSYDSPSTPWTSGGYLWLYSWMEGYDLGGPRHGAGVQFYWGADITTTNRFTFWLENCRFDRSVGTYTDKQWFGIYYSAYTFNSNNKWSYYTDWIVRDTADRSSSTKSYGDKTTSEVIGSSSGARKEGSTSDTKEGRVIVASGILSMGKYASYTWWAYHGIKNLWIVPQ